MPTKRSGSVTSSPKGAATTSARISPGPRLTAAAIAIVLGLIAGTSQIANNGIGWHLGGGRWILTHHQVPQIDPFSFTSANAEWIDHEWLFQVLVAVVDGVGGGPLLVILRAVLVAGLALLLFRLSLHGGLDPPSALVLATLCLYGARIRFLLRPELFTLLIVPAVVWLFTHRDRRGAIAILAALMAIGANLHGGVLVAPPLIAGLVAAEWIRSRVRPDAARPTLGSGLIGLGVVTIAPLLNPYGWRLYTVPLHMATLVGMPHIPNPEWISPTIGQAPPLYAALVVGLVLLAARERDPTRWVLFLMAAVLALRHVRNVGLFFMLLPIAIAPAIAGVSMIRDLTARKRSMVVAGVLAGLIAVALVTAPGYRFGLGFADRFYPERACAFIDEHDLVTGAMYNDVRFGGYLIHRNYPPLQVFLDDRNEIHEPLLREIYELIQASDVAGWNSMLDRYQIEVALVRYNHPIQVVSPSGAELGRRGYSTLWFPVSDWALVYWDDTAMVLIRRATADPELIDGYEYQVVRPDDLEHLEHRLMTEPELRGVVSAELARKLDEEPGCRRALDLAEMVMGMSPEALGR